MKEKKTVPADVGKAFLLEVIQRHAARTEEAVLLDLESALSDNDPLLLEVLKYSLLKGEKAASCLGDFEFKGLWKG